MEKDIVERLRDPAYDCSDEAADEIERLRQRIKDAEKAMEPESKLVQDYYKKHPDPVDANIEPCDQ
jgi:hypothetical protein